MSAAEERLIPDIVVLQRNSQHLATKQALLDRQKTLKIPKDFNIESVIEKVNSLKTDVRFDGIGRLGFGRPLRAASAC